MRKGNKIGTQVLKEALIFNNKQNYYAQQLNRLTHLLRLGHFQSRVSISTMLYDSSKYFAGSCSYLMT